MMNYIVTANAPKSLQRQWVRCLLEQGGAYRNIDFDIPVADDVDSYIANNFATLWNDALVSTEDEWLEQDEQQFMGLYRAVAREGVKAARLGGTLTDVSVAMEAAIAANTTKANQLSALQTMASNATAAERDRFFLLCSFLFLSKTVAK